MSDHRYIYSYVVTAVAMVLDLVNCPLLPRSTQSDSKCPLSYFIPNSQSELPIAASIILPSLLFLRYKLVLNFEQAIR